MWQLKGRKRQHNQVIFSNIISGNSLKINILNRQTVVNFLAMKPHATITTRQIT